MSVAQRVHFLEDEFQMTTIRLTLVINHYHINGLHLFRDTLYIYIYIYILKNAAVKSFDSINHFVFFQSRDILWTYQLRM